MRQGVRVLLMAVLDFCALAKGDEPLELLLAFPADKACLGEDGQGEARVGGGDAFGREHGDRFFAELVDGADRDLGLKGHR